MIILTLIITITLSAPVWAASAQPEHIKLTVIEHLIHDEKNPQLDIAASTEDPMGSSNYKLLGYSRETTINYYINPSNKYGLSTTGVVETIATSSTTWDKETSFYVFLYKGITTKTAGKFDGYNVVSWGSYRSGVIAVTYIWYIGNDIVETDCRMNTRYKWSLTGEANKMDVQNIMTHEFGHFCGLADLYSSVDYWLTMYGYSNYGVTYQRTLGTGDINGLIAVYGA
jgi:hypothetical protein